MKKFKKKARDRSLTGKERKRYQEEEKVRGLRNKRKRANSFSYEPQEHMDTILGLSLITLSAISVIVLTADDVTVVGTVDDSLIPPLIVLFQKGLSLVSGVAT